MKQTVEVVESDDYHKVMFTDTDSPEYLLKREITPGDFPMKIGLTKTGELRILEIDFPEYMYHETRVREMAENLRQRFEKEGCKPCITVAEANNTQKTFLVPTLREFFESNSESL